MLRSCYYGPPSCAAPWRTKCEEWLLHLRYRLDSLSDLCRGRDFSGVVRTRYPELGAHDTASSFYYVLDRLFARHPVKQSDVLVDVGCGKGRVIDWWLRMGHTNHIVGIELDETVAAQAERAFADVQNVEVICGNVLDHIPSEGTIFYLYNSFNGEVLREFARRLWQESAKHKEIRIYYVNCEFIEVFRGDPHWRVATNIRRVLDDPSWDADFFDFGMTYPVAVLTPVLYQ